MNKEERKAFRASFEKAMECDCSACDRDRRTLENNISGAVLDWQQHMLKRKRYALHQAVAVYHMQRTLPANLLKELADVTPDYEDNEIYIRCMIDDMRKRLDALAKALPKED